MIAKITQMALALLLPCCAMADNQETYTLEAGKMSMTINAEKGARIMSLKYGGSRQDEYDH